MAPANPWIVNPVVRANPRMRLFCFPYAGGSAQIYQEWGNRLSASIEVFPVELPGHGVRWHEPLISRLDALVAKTAEGLQPLMMSRPFAFFGHSMGALLAFELARFLKQSGRAEPRHLIVAGRGAPHVHRDEPVRHRLPDAEFVRDLRTLNGTSAEILDNAELMAAVLPVLRADFELGETVTVRPQPRLACPILASCGRGDPSVSELEVQKWCELTDGPFRMRTFEGDHFFIATARQQVLEAVEQAIGQS